MIKTRSIYIASYVLLTAAILFPAGLVSSAAKTEKKRYEIKETDMTLAYRKELQTNEIPPIDEAAPSVFETASFGLG